MANDDKIRDEKLQYDINRAAAKLSTLSWGKIEKYEYLTAEKILPSDQSRIIEEAKFTYSPLGKALQKQRKTIEEQRKKQTKIKTSWSFRSFKTRKKNEELKSVEGHFPKDMSTKKIKLK